MSLVGGMTMLRDAEEHAGEHARAAGGWCRHDHSHGGVDFLHGECRRERVGEHRARERAVRVRHLFRVAADQAGHAVQVTDQAAVDRVAHHVERTLQAALDLLAAAQPFVGFNAQGEFAERDLLFFGGADGVDQRIVHQATRSTTRRVFTARKARMRSSAAAPGGESSS